MTESILGFKVAAAPAAECVDEVCRWLDRSGPVKVVACLNPHSVVTADSDPEFTAAMQSADLLIPDGIGIVLASRIHGGRIKSRITGSDLFALLNARLSAMGGRSCFLLGSTTETLEKMKIRMATDFPALRVAGVYSPPFKPAFDREDNLRMIEAIEAAKPDVLWVGMTQPKQEKWITMNRTAIRAQIAAPVGAVFDFYTGNIQRASPAVQKVGLEWLPRLLQEPRRLWRRNVNSLVFMWMLATRNFRRNKGESKCDA